MSRVLEAIYEAIDELNRDRDPQAVLAKSPETVLVGESSQLDSLGIVTLVVAVEEKVGLNGASLMDLLVGGAGPWTVAALAESVEGMTGCS